MVNTMNQLKRYENDGIELIIDLNTGESFATAKGYSRMSRIAYDTIKKRCQRGGLAQAEIPTEQGLKWGTLIPEDTISEWVVKDNPELAKKLIQVGVRIYLHGLAGFKYEVKQEEPVAQPLPQRDAISYVEATKDVQSMPDSILKTLLLDSLVDELALKRNQKLLRATENVKQLTIVKVRAKELGYTPQQIGNGSGLGRYVKSRITPAHQERVGRYSVYHYEVNNELDNAIHDYFRSKSMVA